MSENKKESQGSNIGTIILFILLIAAIVFFFIRGDIRLPWVEGSEIESILEAVKQVAPTEKDMIVGEISDDELNQLVNGVVPKDYDFNILFSCKTAYKNIEGKNTRYLWVGKYQMNSLKYNLYSITKKTAQEELEKASIKGMENESKYFYCMNIEELEEYAAALILKLTDYGKDLKRKGKPDLYLGVNGTTKTCFSNQYFGNNRGTKEMRDAKLSLKCNNVKVESLFLWDHQLAMPRYIALVSADVTCEKNEGPCAEEEWIPKKGETNHVKFILSYFINRHWEKSQDFVQVSLDDILVYDFYEVK